MKKLQLPVFIAVLALLVLTIPGARGDTTLAVTNSGWYDHQIIQYKATAEVTSSPQAANLIAKGNIVYHIVDANGNTPAVQCVPLLAAFPQDATSCNVLNRIPTDSGTTNQYNGGAWNLQVFHWESGVTPSLLNKDDDITAAVNAGLGTLEITSTLVRCPVIDFSSLR
ncbi:hypothetical protein E6H19_07940 [Candidatus Bathyarchaeota archaeon]|nr:MAG: hypothetical protein E6H19_07940 [Candidatus Bathyarchaeota archaeon]